MAVISFSDECADSSWVVAGWAFRQVLSDAQRMHPGDTELAATFERAAEVGFLRLSSLDRMHATKVAAAIKGTAVGILAGTIHTDVAERFDEQTASEYRRGLGMLLEAAEKVASELGR